MSDLPLPEFHRLENIEYVMIKEEKGEDIRKIPIAVSSFKTRRYGIVQIGYDETGTKTMEREPGLHVFTEEQKEHVEKHAAAAYYIATTEFG